MKTFAQYALTEAIPINVEKAFNELDVAQTTFMKQYAKFKKAVPIKESGEYGDKLNAMDQKIRNATKKAYADVQKKQKQFDQSVWAMHLR
jgi:hypothetical protein